MLDQSRTQVIVRATDPILQNGVHMALRTRPEVWLVDEDDASPETVALVVTDRFDDRANHLLKTLQVRGFARVVLVAGELEDSEILTAVEGGVCAVARRVDTTPDVLVRLVKAASAGEGALPPDLLGRLLNRVSRLQRHVLEPRGLHLAGITNRETEVLRLVASGMSTKEIADKLCYSQRTVKSILHDVTNRFQLRNRSHAVAYALREGLI
ncbi:DNA-binding response regulator, NarL/FixJ family, contains REC and HTH domains [Actinokineospora alba]|uniref:DNA-binding response regulator, NarL/FixJ family, contains REC and HTH domains n=1 Tax=Actinokineospora alba TaxID=504798 RepID=A0A1H0N1H0_9PSEU|nr:response regulator transcription factor [Actinokineospora alba]TDP68522.1 DNA-binding NarL/FixJ family response regulator [Actinokineospora alba]SDH80872.1 DNA-binding response regulator, NarL/FixJ family, contains REC and HTH domains [Actinokineospora alba]SDO86507.1 DNA-binding response regulator, NarL/FixJ family, contains REC and HTH domains [Actinokineospora alba]